VNINLCVLQEDSKAQCLLKTDLKVILKLPQEEINKHLKPKVLHSKNEVFLLPKFFDHLYQEIRRWQFMKDSEAKKNKPNKHKVMEE
jgi:hypothetical protein